MSDTDHGVATTEEDVAGTTDRVARCCPEDDADTRVGVTPIRALRRERAELATGRLTATRAYWVGTSGSAGARHLRGNPQVTVHIGTGDEPVIVEGIVMLTEDQGRTDLGKDATRWDLPNRATRG